MKVLVVDVGGTHVKIRVSGKRVSRKFASGPTLTAKQMVSGVKKLAGDWRYDVVSIGYPGSVIRQRPSAEPHNLGTGWVGFDFEKAFGRPVKVVNDAAMQALGDYNRGKMLFLGLGTGLGSALIADSVLLPMELGHLPYKSGTFEDYVGLRGLKKWGQRRWRRLVADVVPRLAAALQAEDVVLGGGNVKKLKELPPGSQGMRQRECLYRWISNVEGIERPATFFSQEKWCHDSHVLESPFPMSFQPIENYGVIGNMRSIALVGIHGSIDFLCYPDFDSPTVFAALLDDKNGGCFQIEPQLTNVRIRQLYLPDTNTLLTRFLAEEGVAELTDFMPIEKDGKQPNEIIRMVSVIRGNVQFHMHCLPRFNYGRCTHRAEISDRCATFFPADNVCPPMGLYSTVSLERKSQDVTSRFSLRAGETATFVLGGLRSPENQPEMELASKRFQRTSRFWKAWIAKSKYKGRWREMVNRSALILKLLISREHGSLIAAPTFSLPENIGGVRNWDYRYTWLRDATFTLYALIRLGFVEETEAFIDWLLGRLCDNAERGTLTSNVSGGWPPKT